jgi:hypothetical protein
MPRHEIANGSWDMSCAFTSNDITFATLDSSHHPSTRQESSTWAATQHGDKWPPFFAELIERRRTAFIAEIHRPSLRLTLLVIAQRHISRINAAPLGVTKFLNGRSMRGTIPSRDQVGHETPLRLGVAAALAFPDGTMTASGLRREAARGRLIGART